MTEPADDPPPRGGEAADRPDRADRPSGRTGHRPGPAVGGYAYRESCSARPERAEAAQQERTAAPRERARRPTRPDAGRGDESRPDDLDGRVRRAPRRRSARSCRRKLASLRDDVPPVPFAQARADDAPGARRPAHAGVLGVRGAGVRRGVDRPGPSRGHASPATRWRSRSSTRGSPRRSRPICATRLLLLPLVKRLAPGLDARPLFAELRERIGEELDYELEAQHQRRVERLLRGHPFMLRAAGRHRALHAAGARHRVRRGRAIRGRARAPTSRARPLRRDRVPLLLRPAVSRSDRARGSPPGQLPAAPRRPGCVPRLRPAARRRRRARATRSGRSRGPSATRTPPALKSALVAGGYLPAERADIVDPDLALRMMRTCHPLVRRARSAPVRVRRRGAASPAPRAPRARRRGARR